MHLHLKKVFSAIVLLCLFLTFTLGVAQEGAQERSVIETIDAFLDRAEQAREAFENSKSSGEESAARDARSELGRAERELDEARVRILAREGRVTTDRIWSMRFAGRGWGDIAKELKIHPGVLGRGHGKGSGNEQGKGKGKGRGQGRGE
jgi:hypothetical protein